MKFFIVLGTFAVLAMRTQAAAIETKDSTPAASSDVATSVTPTSSSDTGYKLTSLIPSSFGTVLTIGGTAVFATISLLAIAAVVSPLFGFRLCQLFRTCELPAKNNQAEDISTDYPKYDPSVVQYDSGYQKRSTGYVGPVIKTLSSMYDNYGPGGSLLGSNHKNVGHVIQALNSAYEKYGHGDSQLESKFEDTNIKPSA